MNPKSLPARPRPMTDNEARRVLTIHFQTAVLALIATTTATAAIVLLTIGLLSN